eukprot:m.104944 g.104944  ORF g.104944 m.104944 type:complete len:215 (-) comp20979_c0_seq1:749-1393(-)
MAAIASSAEDLGSPKKRAKLAVARSESTSPTSPTSPTLPTSPHSPPEEVGDHGVDDIDARRQDVQNRYNHSMNTIIAKYEAEGAEHGDVLDLDTEEVVEDHGELASMKAGCFGMKISTSPIRKVKAASEAARSPKKGHTPLDATVRGLGRVVTPHDPRRVGATSTPAASGLHRRERSPFQTETDTHQSPTSDEPECHPVKGCTKLFCFRCASKD